MHSRAIIRRCGTDQNSHKAVVEVCGGLGNMSQAMTHLGCYSRVIYESERAVGQHCTTELPITIADAWDLANYEKQPDSTFVVGGPMCKPFCVWGPERRRIRRKENSRFSYL